jgi:hypothetical protein
MMMNIRPDIAWTDTSKELGAENSGSFLYPKPGRPSIPEEDKNILATFSLKQWQVARLKETKNKSKLIQYLLTKHFNAIP